MTTPVTYTPADYNDMICRMALELRYCQCPQDDKCGHCKNMKMLFPMLRQAAAEGQGNESALAHERNNTAYWQSQAEALARRVAAFRAEFFYGASGGRVEQEMFAALKRHHMDRVTPEDPTEPTPPPAVVKRCGDGPCQHFVPTETNNGDIEHIAFCKHWDEHVPEDGSGFCHLHEATK